MARSHQRVFHLRRRHRDKRDQGKTPLLQKKIAAIRRFQSIIRRQIDNATGLRKENLKERLEGLILNELHMLQVGESKT